MIFFPGLLLSHNLVLIAAAVIPAVILMIKVYKSDKLEPESPVLLRNLVIAGVLSALIALVEETVLTAGLNLFAEENTLLYNILMYYIVVAVSEESSKYLMMKRHTWNNPEFDCRFDGIVYAVFTSLGFALWENISYVMTYGFSTALVRAVTAVPGHACFGVFMGIFYTMAKEYDYMNNKRASGMYRKLAVIVPVLFHGTYDFIATMAGTTATLVFLVFVAVMFLICYRLVDKMARRDRHMTWRIIE